MLAIERPSPKEFGLTSNRKDQHFSKMPVDYASYLLSASPPGFELAYQFRLEGPVGGPRGRRTPPNPFVPIITPHPERDTNEDHCFKTNDDLDLDEVSQNIASLLVEEFQSTKSNSFPMSQKRLTNPIDCMNKNNCAKGKTGLKKKVSFADDMGKSLVQVRVISESTDTPPVLRPEFLDSLSNGASPLVSTPPLVLNFAQPASDYVAFRKKLEENNVSLENVILKDYKLIGTVKVKNLAFEKSVCIRGTTDSWDTVQEVQAKFCENLQASSSQFDTFSFEFNVPPKFDVKKKVQFAVCYQTDGQQFWDNNNGANYEVLSENFTREEKQSKEKKFENPVFNLNHYDDRWSEFSSWSSSDNTIPYW